MKRMRANDGQCAMDTCVIGVGAYTPVGLTAASAAAAVRAGIPGFREHPYVSDRQTQPMIVAPVPLLDLKSTGLERFESLLLQPLGEALSAAPKDTLAIPLILGLPPQRPGRPPNLEQELLTILRAETRVGSVECISAGHSSGLMALELAYQRIQNGSIELCLVGGIDSYLHPETLEWLEANGQLHGGDNAYGFIPGEAAGFCLLSSSAAVERARSHPLARVRVVATAREPNLIKTDSICLGRGLTDVFRKVLAGLSSPEDQVGHTICDMNGEPYRADEYGFTVARVSPRFVDASDFVAPADCWGDVGAASGPLFVNLVVAAGLRGCGRAQHNLLWTSSETGERSAAILYYDHLTATPCP
jgi:3-oxoacyl-[acyl-carrier-protein] synthase I